MQQINGMANAAWDDDLLPRVRVVVEFIRAAVKILDEKGVPDHLKRRVQHKLGQDTTFYDYLADMIFEVIFSASGVRSPQDLCWWIQHNSVWAELFSFEHLQGKAGRVVKFKVRRLVYNELARMKIFPDYKGAKILGLCLNVMIGRNTDDKLDDPDMGALLKAVTSWTKKNYSRLHSHNPAVAEAGLSDGVTYDAVNLKFVKTYAVGLSREPDRALLSVDPAPPQLPDAQ